MNATITPFLLFDGRAREAMLFYVSLFPNSRVLQITNAPTDTKGRKDSIEKATFTLNGREFMCGDSTMENNVESAPAFYIHIDCEIKRQLHEIFDALSVGGKILNPLESVNQHGYLGQVLDKFGVTWRLNVSKQIGESTEGNVCFANSKEVRPEYRDE